MEYDVVLGYVPSAFCEGVARKIAEGWEPLGGIAFYVLTETDRKGYQEQIVYLGQAIVRRPAIKLKIEGVQSGQENPD